MDNLRAKLEASEAELQRVVDEKASTEADLIDVRMELTSRKTLESLSRELDEYFDDPKRRGLKNGATGFDADDIEGPNAVVRRCLMVSGS